MSDSTRQIYRHRITGDKYQELYCKLWIRQGGCCAVCGARVGDTWGITRTRITCFHIDHSHETGAIRGLLCLPCNTHVGNYEREEGKEKEVKWLRRTRIVIDYEQKILEYLALYDEPLF